jgi:hypothetical protein
MMLAAAAAAAAAALAVSPTARTPLLRDEVLKPRDFLTSDPPTDRPTTEAGPMGIIWEYGAALGGSLGGGGVAPAFTCDTCGKKLDNGLGKIVWEQKPPPHAEGETVSTGRYWILGKAEGHESCDEGETAKHPWEDLDEFLLQIAHNSKLDLDATAKNVAERREKFGI